MAVPEEPERAYRVRVDAGSLDALGPLCREEAPAHRYAVIADETVAGLYGDRVLDSLRSADAGVDLHTFPAGEAAKSREAWAELTDALLEGGHGRDSAVIALGGGVTGDLAGFVAATFMRGVAVVQVPTSLMAMVDSSVGGKTAVDTPEGKNLVGAFHHPSLVVADPEVLETLPREHLSAGLAEAVKAGAALDEALFTWIDEHADDLLQADPGLLETVVRRSVALKARVVEEDPEEAGRRAVLNFGHTVGHALERISGYRLLHGRAVAAGMRVEARLGEEAGVTEPGTARRIASVLARCGHVGRPEEEVAAEEVLAGVASDKKGREGTPRVVLLREVGEVRPGPEGAWTHALDDGGLAGRLQAALRPARQSADSADTPP